MLEVALIDGVNDSEKDAKLLVAMAKSIMTDAEGSKVVVNLIPFNDIGHPTYRTPSMENVLGFQKVITDGGVLCYVRTTRGDEENAACGQLATGRRRKG
jgi:23S rRNA (adenine2503-C2)-methyltransferase